MTVNGVTTSPLFERALLGDQSRVPIGAPVITNEREANSKAIQDLMQDKQLTEPLLEHFENFGNDGREAYRDDTKDSIEFRERGVTNDKLIVDWNFDPSSGSLVLVRANRQEVPITGFPVQADLGRGATGPRGQRGNDGQDGFDGEEGEDGDQGCPGPEGKPGDPGADGNEGDPGIIGRQGDDGCEGATGDRGVMGPQGQPGFEGARGATGPSCSLELTGAQGPTGEAFGDGVLFGARFLALMSAAIVGLDDDGIDALEPKNGWTGSKRPPATSTPAVPQPVPQPAKTGIKLCSGGDFPEAKYSCGATSNAYGVGWANYEGPSGAKGLSLLPLAQQNTKAWPNSLVMCGYLEAGGQYTFELSTPPGVAATLFLNCAPGLQVDYGGGTARATVTTTINTGLRLRFLNNAERIPTWCSLRILNAATGAEIYRTGQNATNAGMSGKYAASQTDPNWRSNCAVQQYDI